MDQKETSTADPVVDASIAASERYAEELATIDRAPPTAQVFSDMRSLMPSARNSAPGRGRGKKGKNRAAGERPATLNPEAKPFSIASPVTFGTAGLSAYLEANRSPEVERGTSPPQSIPSATKSKTSLEALTGEVRSLVTAVNELRTSYDTVSAALTALGRNTDALETVVRSGFSDLATAVGRQEEASQRLDDDVKRSMKLLEKATGQILARLDDEGEGHEVLSREPEPRPASPPRRTTVIHPLRPTPIRNLPQQTPGASSSTQTTSTRKFRVL